MGRQASGSAVVTPSWSWYGPYTSSWYQCTPPTRFAANSWMRPVDFRTAVRQSCMPRPPRSSQSAHPSPVSRRALIPDPKFRMKTCSRPEGSATASGTPISRQRRQSFDRALGLPTSSQGATAPVWACRHIRTTSTST